MSIFSGRLGLAVLLAALALGGRTAHAQAAPVRFWIPGGLFGFGANPTAGLGSNGYGNFPGFDGSDARGGGPAGQRYNFSNGWFVGGEGGGMALSMNGIGQAGTFGGPSLDYQGVQFGYNLQSGVPLKVVAGFDTLKYNAGIGGPFAAFDSVSSTTPGYAAHAGVEFQPAPNLSLSLGVGYSQQPGRIDSSLNSLTLPGASSFAVGLPH